MWLVWMLGGVVVVALAVAGLNAFGAWRWSTATQALVRELDAARIDTPTAPRIYDLRELDGLPAPVQRYFRAVLREGQPIIAAATIGLAGTIDLSPDGKRWKPFTSTQRIVVRRPGFLWDARVALMPGVPVRVVDGYVGGRGRLRAAVFGLVTMAEMHGEGEVARDELMRYFAETAWYPTALLPSQGVCWSAVDEHSADATLADGALTLTLRFSFDAAGLIASARSEARGASEGGRRTAMPWEGRWSNYRWQGDMLVPMTGEAAWLPPQGPRVYFVGDVTSLSWDFLR